MSERVRAPLMKLYNQCWIQGDSVESVGSDKPIYMDMGGGWSFEVMLSRQFCSIIITVLLN